MVIAHFPGSARLTYARKMYGNCMWVCGIPAYVSVSAQLHRRNGYMEPFIFTDTHMDTHTDTHMWTSHVNDWWSKMLTEIDTRTYSRGYWCYRSLIDWLIDWLTQLYPSCGVLGRHIWDKHGRQAISRAWSSHLTAARLMARWCYGTAWSISLLKTVLAWRATEPGSLGILAI